MLIVYDTLLGKTKKCAVKLAELGGLHVRSVADGPVSEPFLLVTYTIGFGNVPESTTAFLEQSAPHMIGVASGGNRAWGENFAKAGVTISREYNVPLVHQFELEGTPSDLDTMRERLGELTCDIYN